MEVELEHCICFRIFVVVVTPGLGVLARAPQLDGVPTYLRLLKFTSPYNIFCEYSNAIEKSSSCAKSS